MYQLLFGEMPSAAQHRAQDADRTEGQLDRVGADQHAEQDQRDQEAGGGQHAPARGEPADDVPGERIGNRQSDTVARRLMRNVSMNSPRNGRFAAPA